MATRQHERKLSRYRGNVRGWAVISGLMLGLALPLPARAQALPNSAEELFSRARVLMRAGDCSAALPLLEQSHAIEPAIGTRLNMAICEARVGKLIVANEHLLSVIDGSAPGDDRRAYAERAVQALLPRIPRLVLELDTSRFTLERVLLDGVELSGLKINEPFLIDPGRHELAVVVAGRAPQVRQFQVAERQVYTWVLAGVEAASGSNPASERAEPSSANDRGGVFQAPISDGSRSDGSRASNWSTQRTAAVVAASAALTSFAVATGFAISAKSIHDSSAPYCDSANLCEPPGVERRDRALDQSRFASVAFTVGVAALVAAGTLWFTSVTPAEKARRSARFGVSGNVGATGSRAAGVVLEGSY